MSDENTSDVRPLVATSVCRTYGRQSVLRNLDLALEPGEFVALMGPSGSGKSTFLHLAAGLLAADSGAIAIGGQTITAMRDGAAAKFRRRHLGVVFQAFNLLHERTVRENILLPLALESKRQAKDPQVLARLASLAARLGLTELFDKRPTELSGGEQQRVAVARALIAGPDVILADEPTGNLDAQAAQELCGLLRELNASERRAILLVTHDPVVAAAASRVCFLKEGRIVATHATENDPARVSRLYLEACS